MRKAVTNRHIVAILAVLFAALFALASCSGNVAEPESTSADYVAEAVGSESKSESETETVTEEQTTAEETTAEETTQEQTTAEKKTKATEKPATTEKKTTTKAAATTQKKATTKKATTTTKKADSAQSRTVYRTKTGKKYHYENPCGNGEYYAVSLDDAIAAGLQPCQKCVLH